MRQGSSRHVGDSRLESDSHADDVAGVMWWSFSAEDSSFDRFLEDALAYTDGELARNQELLQSQKLTALLGNLRQRRYLLILDSFEHLLAGHTYLSDPDAPTSVTTVSSDHFRRCAEPLAAKFIRDFQAVPGRSRIVITTQLFPSDLDDLAMESREDLEGFSVVDGAEFLEAQGVDGTRAELEAISDEYRGHPFSLRVLSGLAVHDRRSPGSVAMIRRGERVDQEVGDAAQQALSLALAGLSSDAALTLGHMATFRYPIDYESAMVVNPLASSEDFDAALSDLEDRGLVTRPGDRYDMHALVRKHAYSLVQADDLRKTHAKAAAHLSAKIRSTFASHSDSGVDGLQLLELYYHLLGAEAWDDVRRMGRVLRKQLYYGVQAYYPAYASALVAFVNQRTWSSRGDFPPEREASVLNLLGNALCAMGQIDDARAIFDRALQIDPPESLNVPVHFGNLGARCDLPEGRLDAAEDALRKRISAAASLYARMEELEPTEQVCKDMRFTRNNEAIGRSDLGYLFGLSGRSDESETELLQARDTFGYPQAQGIVDRFRGEVALLRGETTAALDLARSSKELAEQEEQQVRDVVHLECLFARAAVARAEEGSPTVDDDIDWLELAGTHLEEAATRCARAGLVEAEPKVLLARGHFQLASGDLEASRTAFEKALSTASACGYRLIAADARCGLAEVNIASGDALAARGHAQEGLDLAECGSCVHRYELGVQRALALLARLD
jgi:tetratricopeptide (TPR) repeat protein